MNSPEYKEFSQGERIMGLSRDPLRWLRPVEGIITLILDKESKAFPTRYRVESQINVRFSGTLLGDEARYFDGELFTATSDFYDQYIEAERKARELLFRAQSAMSETLT